jgi:hypothetical protein
MRLAKDSTDPVLSHNLTEFALDYLARAALLEAVSLGKDPDDDS